MQRRHLKTMFVGGVLWQLVVGYTGDGRSLSMAMVGTVLNGIHLYLSPYSPLLWRLSSIFDAEEKILSSSKPNLTSRPLLDGYAKLKKIINQPESRISTLLPA